MPSSTLTLIIQLFEAHRRQLYVPMFSKTERILKTSSGNHMATSEHCALKVNLNGIVKLFDFLVSLRFSHKMRFGCCFFLYIAGMKRLQSEFFPDTMVFKFDSPLLAATDCVTEANSAKQICPKIEEARNPMIIGM